MRSVTDRQTDRRQDYANSRSYCVAVRSAKNKLTKICESKWSKTAWICGPVRVYTWRDREKDRKGKRWEKGQEAQLPQRNSASAAHVYLGWLTDRAMHRTPQNRICCTTKIVKSYQLRKRPTYVADEVLSHIYPHYIFQGHLSLCH